MLLDFFFSAKKIIVQCQEHWFISWRSYAKHYASLHAVYYVWDAWSLVDFLIYFLNMWNQIILLLHNHVKYTTFLLGYLYEGRWQQKLIKKWCIQVVMVIYPTREEWYLSTPKRLRGELVKSVCFIIIPFSRDDRIDVQLSITIVSKRYISIFSFYNCCLAYPPKRTWNQGKLQ